MASRGSSRSAPWPCTASSRPVTSGGDQWFSGRVKKGRRVTEYPAMTRAVAEDGIAMISIALGPYRSYN